MKTKDGIIGLVVGDALGVPVEFHSREELERNPITDMTGHGTYDMPKGTWSDDSSMTMATMNSIINKKGIDYKDILTEFCKWADDDPFYNQYERFDIGNTTRRGLMRFLEGADPLECGGTSTHDNGNGSLMRILPLAFIPDIEYETIGNVSALTHGHARSKIACCIYIEIAKSMIKNDLTVKEHVKQACDKIFEYYKDSEELEHFQRIKDYDFSGEIRSGGYVIDSLESSIYCLETTDNYKDAVLKAVNLGIDTDTTAAICGGLAGIYYGFDAIPIDWIESIPHIDRFFSLCEKFEELYD